MAKRPRCALQCVSTGWVQSQHHRTAPQGAVCLFGLCRRALLGGPYRVAPAPPQETV